VGRKRGVDGNDDSPSPMDGRDEFNDGVSTRVGTTFRVDDREEETVVNNALGERDEVLSNESLFAPIPKPPSVNAKFPSKLPPVLFILKFEWEVGGSCESR
jgi:hypothetical protein